MRNRQIVLLIILVVAAAISFVSGIAKPSKPQPKSQIARLGLPAIVQIVPVEKDKKRKSRYVSWGRNPFVKYSAEKVNSFTLNGIIWDRDRSKAIVNGHIVEIGDRVGKGEIIDIRKDSVVVNNGECRLELKLSR